MDIELLRTFLEVERLRHFGKAAQELFVTPAAVSARIKQLEESLGASLFNRTTRHIDLTPEGHRFKRYAERLIVEWRKARHDVATGEDGQQLVIGGTWRAWEAGLQEWVHTLHRKRKELALIVESHNPDMLVRRLLDGQIDVGFMLEPPQIDALEIAEVAELRLVMVCDKPEQQVDAIMDNQFIAVDWGLGQALQHRRLYPDANEPTLRIALGHMAMDFILEFGGAAYLSTRMISSEVRGGELFPIKGAKPIILKVHALYAVRSERREVIEETLELFRYRAGLPRSPAAAENG